MREKFLAIFGLALFVLSGLVFSLAGTDLTGTWEGETYVEGGPTLVLTLTLEHEGEVITGTLADDIGYIDAEISEAK